MYNFKFNIPTKIYFGTNEFTRIKTILKNYKNKRILILTGKNSAKKFSYLDKLINFLNETKNSYEVFSNIEPNPKHSTINEASTLARKTNCELIIALGGGSVMDGAKAVSISAISGLDSWEYCKIKGRKNIKPEKTMDLICIPTLAATGSECDSGAVISNNITKQKAVIHSNLIFPKYSIIDPNFLKTVPYNYIIDGGIDIICHSLETFLSTEDESNLQDYLSFSICRTVKNSLDKIIKTNNDDPKAREELFWSSSLAMIGLLNGRSGPWPMHEIEHGISAVYDISHGLGLTYVLISLLNYNINFAKTNYINKILKFFGFFMHENINYYNDINLAVKDFTKYLESIKAIRNDFNFSKLDNDKIINSILSVYGNDTYIYGLNKLYKKDLKQILDNTKLIGKN